MSTEEIKKTIRNVHEALNKGDVDKAVSFFAEDAVQVGPEGTFKGKNEIKRYFTWLLKYYTKIKFTETELIVEGNKAAHVYVIDAILAKSRGSLSGVAMYEFKNGKVQHVSGFLDRLSIAKQMVRGVIQTRTVNAIIKQMEKGLH